MTAPAFVAHDMPASLCLACGRSLNAASGVDHDHRPSPGDVTVCLRCGHIMIFAEDLTPRDLTAEEVIEVAGDKRILAIQRAREALPK